MDKGDDPYEVLGVPYDADESKIKKAYFKLARQYHPDKQTTEEDKVNNGAVFVRVSDAYDLLNDPVRRYDWKMANEGKMKLASQQRSTGSNSQPTRSSPRMNPPRSSAMQSPPTRSSRLSPPPPPGNVPNRQTPPSRPTSHRASPLAPRRTPQAIRPPYGSPNPRASSNQQHPADRSSMRPNRTSPMQNNHRPTPQAIRPPYGSPNPRARSNQQHPADRSSMRPNRTSPMHNNHRPIPRASCPDYAPTQRQNTPNPFDVLGIHWNADRVEIISAYRILSQKYHPSKQRPDESRIHSAEKMAEVQWAYEVLKDPIKLKECQLGSRGNPRGTPVRRHPLRDRPLGGSMHGTRRSQPRPGPVSRSLSPSAKSKGKSRKVSIIQKLGVPLNTSTHNKKEKKEKPKKDKVNKEKRENKSKKCKKPASFAWKREKSAASSNNSFGTVQMSDSSDSLLEEQESPIFSLIQKLGVPLNMSMHSKEKPNKEKANKEKKEKKSKKSKKPASFAWKREKSAKLSNNSFGTVHTSDSSDIIAY